MRRVGPLLPYQFLSFATPLSYGYFRCRSPSYHAVLLRFCDALGVTRPCPDGEPAPSLPLIRAHAEPVLVDQAQFVSCEAVALPRGEYVPAAGLDRVALDANAVQVPISEVALHLGVPRLGRPAQGFHLCLVEELRGCGRTVRTGA